MKTYYAYRTAAYLDPKDPRSYRFVFGFDSKSTRDAWVDDKYGRHAIKRSELTAYEIADAWDNLQVTNVMRRQAQQFRASLA
jgi:hypothetical protein